MEALKAAPILTLKENTTTPQDLLTLLQDRMLGTLAGYVSRPFIDPMSILTGGKVQLSKYRDFGKNGANSKNKELQGILSKTEEKNVCAIVNVEGHEFQGAKKEGSHYVLVTEPKNSDNYVIQDPGYTKRKALFNKYYKKCYQISVYRAYGRCK